MDIQFMETNSNKSRFVITYVNEVKKRMLTLIYLHLNMGVPGNLIIGCT